MPTGYECDGWCTSGWSQGEPAFIGRLTNDFFKSHPLGGVVSEMGYSSNDEVTLCGECLVDLLEE